MNDPSKLEQEKVEEEAELDQLAEAELARLKRQHRIMEGDRVAYSEEVKILLQRQRQTIEKLEREKKDLTVHLNCLKSRANESKDAKNTDILKKLVETHDNLDREIKYEKSQLGELAFQIKKVEKEIQDVKRKVGCKNIMGNNLEEGVRTEQLLENRLDVTSVKFNRLLASNHRLREDIDHLLKERSLFNQSYQDLSNKLLTGKKVMMDLIEQSTLAYDQREEAQAKLEALRQRGEHELAVHSQEMRELQRRLDLHSKLLDFLAVKGQKRVMADLEAKIAMTKQQEKEALEQQVKKQEGILATIRELCQETDIDRLAALFVKHDEENFALFNYVNELNNELEMLDEQTAELEAMVSEQRESQAARVSSTTPSAGAPAQYNCVQLREQIETQRTLADAARVSRDHCRRALNDLLVAVQGLFQMVMMGVGVSPTAAHPAVLHLLATTPAASGEPVNTQPSTISVTTFNVMLYLGIIGKRTDEIVNEIDRISL